MNDLHELEIRSAYRAKLANGLSAEAELRFAIDSVCERLNDLAYIIDRDGSYDNSGFLRATALRLAVAAGK